MGPLQQISASTPILVDRMTAPFVKENGILLEGRCEEFLHTFHMKTCTHKTH
jgi:hypothetical protein